MSTEPWTCPHCTQLNADWALDCGRCDAPKPYEASPEPPSTPPKLMQGERAEIHPNIKDALRLIDLGATMSAEIGMNFVARRLREAAATIRDHATRQTCQKEYNELIMAVGNVHEGETRHQTALRYIQQAEAPRGPAVEKSIW